MVLLLNPYFAVGITKERWRWSEFCRGKSQTLQGTTQQQKQFCTTTKIVTASTDIKTSRIEVPSTIYTPPIAVYNDILEMLECFAKRATGVYFLVLSYTNNDRSSDCHHRLPSAPSSLSCSLIISLHLPINSLNPASPPPLASTTSLGILCALYRGVLNA